MAVDDWQPFAAQDDDDDDAVVDWFERVAEDAAAAQAETLRRILEANLGAEYLQRWLAALPADLGDMSARELEALFVSAVPLASHADFEPYIRRIAAGDVAPLLTRRPITMLSLR